jgi:DNA-binding response OmpR family regulator
MAPVQTDFSQLEREFDRKVLANPNAEDQTELLLVEDNGELADFIIGSLPTHYRIHRAANGDEGLRLATDRMPELIISDVLMPVMDGFEFCRKIKADDATSHIPVILLTAKTSTENRLEGLSLGADDYITKPFLVSELQLRVRNLLEQRRKYGNG